MKTGPRVAATTGAVAPAARCDHPTEFERLVRLLQSNERLSAEQRVLAGQAPSGPGLPGRARVNSRLGMANLSHVRVKHSGVLALLRANRLEARESLTEPASPTRSRSFLPSTERRLGS